MVWTLTKELTWKSLDGRWELKRVARLWKNTLKQVWLWEAFKDGESASIDAMAENAHEFKEYIRKFELIELGNAMTFK